MKRNESFQREELAFQQRFKALTFAADEDEYRWFENYEEGAEAFVKKHLRTEVQRQWLYEHDLTIADLFKGRYQISLGGYIQEHIFDDWNQKLGRHHFGGLSFE